jgi:hypothetical protein
MSRLILVAAFLVLVAPNHAAGQAPAQEVKVGTFPYPASAPVVVCLNGYDKARERLEKLLTLALPIEGPKIAKQLQEELDHVFEDRKLTAVRTDARIFLVVNNLADLFEDDAPPVSVLVPVRAYKEFRDTFLTKEELKTLDVGRDGVDTIRTPAFGAEMPLYMVDLKDYVALSTNRGSAELYAAKYVVGSADAMGPGLAESFLKSDLALFVNMDAINDRYGDEIRGIKGLIDFALQQALQEGMLPGFNKKQMETVKVVLKGLFQGVEDCRAVVVTAEFLPQGLSLQLKARFAENSASANQLALERPSPFADVARLPVGLGIYNGTRFGTTFSELLREMSQGFSTTEEDMRGEQLIEKHLADLGAAGHRGETSASAAPGQSITVMHYRDPNGAVRALTKTYKAVAAGGKVNAAILKAAPRVSDDSAKHREFTFSEVRLSFDYEATVAGLPDQVKLATLHSLKRTMNEQTTLWIGTNDKVVVQLMAKDWNDAKTLLDKYLDGKPSVGETAGYKLTRSYLPVEANVLVIAETGAALEGLMDALRSAGDAIPIIPPIPALKRANGEPTYVGMAIALKEDTVTMSAFVPTGAITTSRKILEAVFKKIE